MSQASLKVYRSKISYFSGKLEAYLRYKEIPHEIVDSSSGRLLTDLLTEIDYHCGVKKIPAILMPDGKWLFDTTPTIQWLESEYPKHPVVPNDPVLKFLALLIEDYGDEWLWRPAMWWRWVPKVSKRALGSTIMAEVNRPAFLGGMFARRQLKEWVWGDGVTPANSDKVRDMLFDEFAFLEPLFAEQPFILGNRPSVADFGYFGSMFRHFGNDPDPAEVMRTYAPNTYEWLARLWNLKSSQLTDTPQWNFPAKEYWNRLLERLICDYLPYLVRNATAFSKGLKRFDYEGKNHRFLNTITTDYRVLCLENIQQEYKALSSEDAKRAQKLFDDYGNLDNLLNQVEVKSGLQDFFVMPKESVQGVHFKGSRKSKTFSQPRN